MNNVETRLLVIGFGSIGKRHYQNLLHFGHKVCVYDPNFDHSEDNVEVVPSIDVGLNDPTVSSVLICSPSEFHDIHLINALRHGKHCFVEKPVVTNFSTIQTVKELAMKNNVSVFPGFHLRYNPALIWFQKHRKKLDLGKLLWFRAICSSWLPGWRDTPFLSGYAANPTSGGVIFDLSHEFDLVRQLFGSFDIGASMAQSDFHINLPADEMATILVSLNCGALGHMHLDYVSRKNRREIEIAFSNGFVKIDLLERTACISPFGENDVNFVAEDALDSDYQKEIEHFIQTRKYGFDQKKFNELAETCLAIEIARKKAGLPVKETSGI